MFTGIVEELGKVIEIMPNHLCIEGHVVMEALEISDSISINGVCLTVVAIENNSLCVDLSAETLRRTNLGFVEEGQSVNLERAVTPSTRMGGHIVQGHVDTCGTVVDLSGSTTDYVLKISLNEDYSKYIVGKGFIAIDGVSLTVVETIDNEFTIAVIPYTLENTVLKSRKLGDLVNIEIDIFAKYIERFISAKQG